MIPRSKRALQTIAIILVAFSVVTSALPISDRAVGFGHEPLRYGSKRALGSWKLLGYGTKLAANRRSNSSVLFVMRNNNDGNAKNVSSIASFFSRRNFLATAAFFLVPPILLETYSRLGVFAITKEGKGEHSESQTSKNALNSFLSPPKSGDWENIEHATIVFHGAGGQDSYTDELMARLEASDRSSNRKSYQHIVDWSEFSTNILQASYNGQKIGALVARELVEKTNLKTIHFIGISVGAFCADAAVTEVKRNFKGINSDSTAPFVQLTLLDPFQQRGIFGVGYGDNVFGKSADYAEQFLNTDDPVPSTNKPLKNTVCYDVTKLRPENIFGHDWPLVYYARSDRCGKLEIEHDEAYAAKLRKGGSVTFLTR